MLEEAGDPPTIEQRGDRVKVAEVRDDHMVQFANPGVLERTQKGGRTGVHQEERLVPGPGPGDRLHPGHSPGDLRGEKSETLEPGAALHLFTQIVETKAPVTDARRRGAVVEDGHRHRIEYGAYVKNSERVHQLGEIEVAHLQAAGARHATWTVDNADAHCFDPGQVIVEGSRRVRGRVDLQSLAQVRFDGPVVGATAHRHAGQEQVGPCGRGLLYLLGEKVGR